MTHIYIDLEFSELTDRAEPISFGAVALDGREIYLEFDPLPGGCSEFVRLNVLPLLEGGASRCPRLEFVGRIEAWLGQFDEPIVLVADSPWDWRVLRRALNEEGFDAIGALRVGGLGVTLVPATQPTGVAGDIYETARLQCFLRDPRRHHALVDARALRAAELAIAGSRLLPTRETDSGSQDR